jgi:hypothetical protein
MIAMRNLQTVLVMLSALLTSVVAQTQDRQPALKTQEAAAAQALEILRSLSEDRSRDLGFTAANADRTTLGAPLAVYSVDLEALKEFREGQNASDLIGKSPAAFYPVLLDGTVRTSVRVENTTAGWEPARVGNAGLAMAVDRARHALPSPDDPTIALVQVLALNLVFVGQKTGADWVLVPVIDDASVELKAGTPEPAERIFARLATVAARHNGQPT